MPVNSYSLHAFRYPQNITTEITKVLFMIIKLISSNKILLQVYNFSLRSGFNNFSQNSTRLE